MNRRSRAREVALQVLFQCDQNPKGFARPAMEQFVSDRLRADTESVRFCLSLYDGVVLHQATIDKVISVTADNWRLNRMLPVDRNLLRLAVYEMLHAKERTPAPVAINETIELARRFGSQDSPAFVNGILDKIAKRPKAEPVPVPVPVELPAEPAPPTP